MQAKLSKIKDLNIPDLRNRSFLELGSEEGTFCGFARFLGAIRVVGIESDSDKIALARNLYPECEFLQQGFNQLPAENFDVILALDVLHTVNDQEKFIAKLVDKLTSLGVLVIEFKVIPTIKSGWVSGEQYNLEGTYPSSNLMPRLLEGYAWKMIHMSQLDNGILSYVYHISPRKPYLYLLMQPSGFGKSSIARNLFFPAGVPVINTDGFVNEVVLGTREVQPELKEIIVKDFSRKTLGATYTRIFQAGLGELFIQKILEGGDVNDIALDGYIPQSYHKEIVSCCKSLGYIPISLYWEKPQPYPISRTVLNRKIDRFLIKKSSLKESYFSLLKRAFKSKALGHVDQIGLTAKGFVVVGWAVDEKGYFPNALIVKLAVDSFEVELGDPLHRPDVEDHLGLSQADYGYSFEFIAPEVKSIADLFDKGFSVEFLSGEKLNISSKLKK